jgi:hypothetical protein
VLNITKPLFVQKSLGDIKKVEIDQVNIKETKEATKARR